MLPSGYLIHRPKYQLIVCPLTVKPIQSSAISGSKPPAGYLMKFFFYLFYPLPFLISSSGSGGFSVRGDGIISGGGGLCFALLYFTFVYFTFICFTLVHICVIYSGFCVRNGGFCSRNPRF